MSSVPASPVASAQDKHTGQIAPTTPFRVNETPAPVVQATNLQQSISDAIVAAMGTMSASLTQSISQALMAQPVSVMPPPASRTLLNDGSGPSTDCVNKSRKRANPRPAERVRSWKTARALPDPVSDSDAESVEEAGENWSTHSGDELADIAVDTALEDPSLTTGVITEPLEVAKDTVIDPMGDPLFNPDQLHHPRSSEWLPATHVTQYLEARIRTPLSKEARSKLRAECPRPLIPNKICETPTVDPKVVQFLAKTGFNPRKGLDSALKACQDKLLDMTGPLAKILDLAETARVAGTQVDPEDLSGWAQRAICLVGNVNTSIAIERRKAILMKIEPKLANLSLSESGKEAQGLLFGDPFIKELGKYVGAFTALDKAQSSMRRVFQSRFSSRAGSLRGRLSGRSNFQPRGTGRGSFNYRQSLQDPKYQPTFFPSRGGSFRSRGFRGAPGSRRPYG
ncbi:uncharacterized protein LOC122936383 [Bufo gargarizans]|uniref:uncharacterized protein LOC122926815 n=1 Tax=Bufo gargarizans TaxID=30331 RepID=UPI001CF2D5DE|nr:uncharacterized protein LOC122926815 [Bufo gargarizans]XP_044142924.1 uncharacterized protein LOC122932523 [Bufo gargarizans]XP_044148502.1 uncharacterized protein LOC122936383 [Bufo gargarizans]